MLNDLFNNPRLRRTWLKVRYPLALLFLLFLLRYVRSDMLLPAFLVSLFGEAIQTWSFASLVKNTELTIRGPYVLVRNPMYLGRYFLGLGFVLLFGNLWLVVGYSVIYVMYMVNRVRREEARLVGLLPGYDEYRRKVHAFLPGPGMISESRLWYFDWPTLRMNHGDRNFIVFLLIYAAIAAYVLLAG
jgi:protein-S-isoprenylcysteine O-methyltransferase Ste14